MDIIFLYLFGIPGSILALAWGRQVVLSIIYVGFSSLIVFTAMIGIGDYYAGDQVAIKDAYIDLGVGMAWWFAAWAMVTTILALKAKANEEGSLIYDILEDSRRSNWNRRHDAADATTPANPTS